MSPRTRVESACLRITTGTRVTWAPIADKETFGHIQSPAPTPGALPAAGGAPTGRSCHANQRPRRRSAPGRGPSTHREPDTGSPALSADTLWYKDAVFYELHVKAFQDSS